MYLIIIGKDQVYTDMPEYRNHPDPAYQNERVRGTGGRPTSFGEENLLSLPIDRYDDESIAVHEFCHTIDGTFRAIDSGWRERLRTAFIATQSTRAAIGTPTPPAIPANTGPRSASPTSTATASTTGITARSALASNFELYDPDGYELVRTTFNLSPAAGLAILLAPKAAERRCATGTV